MARQNNEDPAVSHSHRKVASTRADEPVGGEKGVPVTQQVWQLDLFTGTAEYPEARAEGPSAKRVGPRAGLRRARRRSQRTRTRGPCRRRWRR